MTRQVTKVCLQLIPTIKLDDDEDSGAFLGSLSETFVFTEKFEKVIR